ncbi:MAG: MBL fold metallo-hydrolase [Desulfovibrio sp.]|nr:MBL fold metallo-hydrolase [Desulfovibrio sp.]
MALANFPLGPLQTNSYLLHNANDAVAIDVGGDPSPMLAYLSDHKLTLKAICITHMHFDHIYGVHALAESTKAKVFCPAKDDVIAHTEASLGGIWGFPKVTAFKSETMPLGETSFAGMSCLVLETPGHTPGSVSLYFNEEKVVFSGDALFYQSIGRTDFPMGSLEQLMDSIRNKLFSLPGKTRVLPGHGPETTIEDEKVNNPYCGEFAYA